MPKRQIGLAGAVAIGLASMLGAGVFVVFRNVAVAAGSLQLVAIAIASCVAILNAASIYQLAQHQSRAGGVYAYSRIYISEPVSFVAGFSFVFGKIGSIAAIALVFEEYVMPGSHGLLAVAAIVVMTAINLMGINRTAAVAAVTAIVTISFLIFVIVVSSTSTASVAVNSTPVAPGNVWQGAALMFFAFAGYARVATLGTEVRKPNTNIPSAIVISLGAVLIIYFLLAQVFNTVLGPSLAQAKAPFRRLLEITFPALPSWVIIAVAALAALGSMLALLAGVSRTLAVMAEDREAPKALQRRSSNGAPWVAELIVAVGAIVLVQIGDLSWVIGFSSFSVLLYYAIGHFSSFRQPKGERFMPKTLNLLGIVLCLALILSVPGPAAPITIGVLLLAVVARSFAR
jgi:APA family basic amino acid/polyamine antiporter